MESVEQSSMNAIDNKTNIAANVNLLLQNQDIHCSNNNNNVIQNNNNLQFLNNKMVSGTIIKHEMSESSMPSAHTAATVATVDGMEMDNTNQQQQQIANMNKCQQIVNKSTVTIVNHRLQQQQQLPHNNGSNINAVATTINSPKMGSRRIFTPQFKLQVLESYRNDNDCKGNQRATARKYNIHRRQIQKWLQCESNLRSSVANINQSQVKHQFHNLTPNATSVISATAVATTQHNNSQFVSQQQQQQQHHSHHHHQQQQQQQLHYEQQLKQQQNMSMSSSITVPSPPAITNTPCTAAGVLVAANFAAAVAAASASMTNMDKHCGTRTTAALSPLRPTAIVGGASSDDGGSNTAGILHPHAHLPHLTHHLPPHHTHHHHHSHHPHHPHHHVHAHAHHHHHPYNTLPYTHTAVPMLTHHQPLYPHPAAAALLAVAHHHLPTHQLPTPVTLHHHYQQQQHEYHSLQQHQQHQQTQLFGASACVTSTPTTADKEQAFEVEVVGDADTESEAEIENINNTNPPSPLPHTTKTTNSYERGQLFIESGTTNKFENGNGNSCNRVCLTAVYKLQQQQQQKLPQQPYNDHDDDEDDDDDDVHEKEEGEEVKRLVDVSDIEHAAITPIDLSYTGARRHNNKNNHHYKIMTKDESVQKHDKHVPNSRNYNNNNSNDVDEGGDDVVTVVGNNGIKICNQQTTNNNALVVDLTFRKRKVISHETAITTTLDDLCARTSATITNTQAKKNTSSTSTESKDDEHDDAQPEKMPKFSVHQSSNTSVSSNGVTSPIPSPTPSTNSLHATTIEIKQEHLSSHDVNTKPTTNTNTTRTSSAAQNVAAKPVKLFKPYLLHEEDKDEKEEDRTLEEAKFHLTAAENMNNNRNLYKQKQQQTQLSLTHYNTPATELITEHTFQGVANANDKYTFPITSPYFQSNTIGGSKPTSPKSVLCSPTSPIGFQRCSKGSPVSGYESSSSTYSECSSYRGLSHYSLDLQLRAVYSEQLGSPPRSHYSPPPPPIQQHPLQQQQQLHNWLDQDTQSSLTTYSTRSSPTPTLTPTTTPTPMPPTTTTPPAADTSIALYA